MERRFTAAFASALALHAALVAMSMWWVADGELQHAIPANLSEIDVVLLPPDAEAVAAVPAPSPPSPGPSVPRAVERGSSSNASAALGGTAVAGEATAAEPGAFESEAAVGSSDVAPSASGAAPRRPIDLGLDGAIVARALRDTPPRPPARRPSLTFDGWSEGIVRSLAHRAAPSEGSALLTVEWDAQGRLASIRSSAASSNANAWKKLAESLRPQLARRPQGSKGGLRLVYLLKSEVVKPGSRSKLPQSRHVSGEQLRDEHLPPAVSLNVGVKADTTPTGQRVVSVMLASSQML
jgi:hypothetical protein